MLTRIEEYSAAIQDLREESAKLQKEAEAFQLEVGDFDQLDAVQKDVESVKQSWDRCVWGVFGWFGRVLMLLLGQHQQSPDVPPMPPLLICF